MLYHWPFAMLALAQGNLYLKLVPAWSVCRFAQDIFFSPGKSVDNSPGFQGHIGTPKYQYLEICDPISMNLKHQ